MIDPISLTLSGISLAISITNIYLTLLKKGKVRMTQPTTVFFGPDNQDGSSPKIYLRTLLYSSSKNGQIVQSMFLKVGRGESTQVFNIWIYGEERLSRGSGLYVGQEGVVCNHHFLLPEDENQFSFQTGLYNVEAYASLVGRKIPIMLWKFQFTLDNDFVEALRKNKGIYIDWGPESSSYHSHVGERPTPKIVDPILFSLLKQFSINPPTIERQQSD